MIKCAVVGRCEAHHLNSQHGARSRLLRRCAPTSSGRAARSRVGRRVPGFFGPTPPPPHEVASFLMQSAMLGGRDLEGGALVQRGQLFAGEPTDLDAPALGFCVELRPVGESSAAASKSPSRQRGVQWWTSALVSAAITPPWFRRFRSLPYQDDPRHRRHAGPRDSRPRREHFSIRLLTRH